MSFYLFIFSGPNWNSQGYFPQLIGKDCGPFPFPDEALTEMFVGLCGLGDFVQVTEYEVVFFFKSENNELIALKRLFHYDNLLWHKT